jgi:hypothetical protein
VEEPGVLARPCGRPKLRHGYNTAAIYFAFRFAARKYIGQGGLFLFDGGNLGLAFHARTAKFVGVPYSGNFCSA